MLGGLGGCCLKAHGFVLLAGVDPVLELDDSHLAELVPEPATVAVEQAQLLAVRHDLREQELLERVLVLVALVTELPLDLGAHVAAHPLPDPLLENPVAPPPAGPEREQIG